MNNKFQRFLIGFLYGCILSLFCSLIIAFFGNTIAGGGSFGGSLWIFIGLCVPLSVTFGISAYYSTFKGSSLKKYWLFCIIMGFINVLYMGTIGAIMASGMKYGIENVNIEGYLAWGPIYAAIFLPISTLVIAVLMIGLRSVLKNKNLLKTE